jgi:hypothetical protein
MKTIKIIVILVILGFNNTFAQVTTEIESVIVNSTTTYTNCNNLIDFGLTSNNTVNFSYKLTKPAAQVLGNGTLRVILKSNSVSSGIEKSSMTILSVG